MRCQQSLLPMREENNSVIAGSLAVEALSLLALECLHVALERVLLHLPNASGNLAAWL